MDQNTPQVQPVTWPPPPVSQSDVWPPPPAGQGAEGPAFAFRSLYLRVQGTVSDFREGVVRLEPSGLVIQGKAVPRAEIQALVLIPCVLLSLILAVVASLLMEYAFRRDQLLTVAWAQVRQIVLVPAKGRVGIAFEAPNAKGKMKPYTLAFPLDPQTYAAFVAEAQRLLPDRTREGNLRSGNSPLVVGVLVFIVVAVIVGAVFFATSSHH